MDKTVIVKNALKDVAASLSRANENPNYRPAQYIRLNKLLIESIEETLVEVDGGKEDVSSANKAEYEALAKEVDEANARAQKILDEQKEANQ